MKKAIIFVAIIALVLVASVASAKVIGNIDYIDNYTWEIGNQKGKIRVYKFQDKKVDCYLSVQENFAGTSISCVK